jgi:hypothetical protein
MLQASTQKIDLHGLAAHFPFQLRQPGFFRAAVAVPGKRLGPVVTQLAPPAMQTLGLTSQARATSAIEAPNSSRLTAASLNSLVNFLRDRLMTLFSIK